MSPSLTCLLFLLALCAAEQGACPESDQIRCSNQDKCTRIRYICDGDNDCGDNSDEDDALCQAWRNRDCERNSAQCYRFGASNCVTISRYCELSDPACEGDVDPRLCQMLQDGLLQDLDSIVITPNTTTVPGAPGLTQLEVAEALGEKFTAQAPHTLQHEGCPLLFTRFADTCLSIFYPGNLTWGAAREFCHTIGGELLQLNRDYSFYASLVQHFIKYEMTADFWLGGAATRYNSTSEASWTWLDGSPVDATLPYWALRHTPNCTVRPINDNSNITTYANQGHCYQFSRAPANPTAGECLALTYESYYTMADVGCLEYKSPLCVVQK